jgi:UPF0755 protein
LLSRVLSYLAFFLMVSMMLLTVGAFGLNYWLHTPLNLSEEKLIAIAPGDTLGKISYQLAREKILNQPRLLILVARLLQQDKIEVGEYRIPAHSTPEHLLKQLQYGKVVSYSVTLVEGKSFQQFLENLAAQEKLTLKLKDKNFEQIIAQLELDIEHPEGWFYPDTYQYVSGSSDVDILLQAHHRMRQVLAREWEKRSTNLPYKTRYEALTMASIIEKETGVAREREEISGVFVRRLQKGMRLQTDPTVIYGLGDTYKGNIRRKHLKQPTPYNTYVIKGLPPTPIAMPGRDAIYAALHPDAGESLYFVAKGDGSHQFSKTLEQHNQAVQQYQIKKRASNYRSVPVVN